MPSPYLTALQVRDRQPAVGDVTKYPDATITRLVEEFEYIAEEYRSTAFTSRTQVDTFSRPSWAVTLRTPLISITSFTVDGTAGNVADLTIDYTSGLVYGGSWSAAKAVVFTYVHGIATTPEPVLRACAEYVRACLQADRAGTSRDVISQSFDGGGMTRYSTPDWEAGRPTGFLEVDRLLNTLQGRKSMGLA